MQPAELADIARIEQLKARYVRAGDIRDWELLASTLHPKVDASFGRGLVFKSADEMVSTVRSWMDSSRITVHCLHQPEIQVRGDAATGTWLMTYRTVNKSERTMVEGAGHYADEYSRAADGSWLISRTRLERLYEVVTPWDALPGFSLTADHLATSGGRS